MNAAAEGGLQGPPLGGYRGAPVVPPDAKLSKEQKEELLKLRAQGLSWADEQERGTIGGAACGDISSRTPGSRGFTAEETQLLGIVEGWMRGLSNSKPSTCRSQHAQAPRVPRQPCAVPAPSLRPECESPGGADPTGAGLTRCPVSAGATPMPANSMDAARADGQTSKHIAIRTREASAPPVEPCTSADELDRDVLLIRALCESGASTFRREPASPRHVDGAGSGVARLGNESPSMPGRQPRCRSRPTVAAPERQQGAKSRPRGLARRAVARLCARGECRDGFYTMYVTVRIV